MKKNPKIDPRVTELARLRIEADATVDPGRRAIYESAFDELLLEMKEGLNSATERNLLEGLVMREIRRMTREPKWGAGMSEEDMLFM